MQYEKENMWSQIAEDCGDMANGHKIVYDDGEVRWHDLLGRRYRLYERCDRPTIHPEVLQRAKDASLKSKVEVR